MTNEDAETIEGHAAAKRAIYAAITATDLPVATMLSHMHVEVCIALAGLLGGDAAAGAMRAIADVIEPTERQRLEDLESPAIATAVRH